jgi:hypothetical protein
MNRRYGFGLIWGVVTLAIAGIVAAIAYHAGQTATVITTNAPAGGTVVYPGYYHDGFGFFWIFPLILLFLFFAFRRPWGNGHWGHGGGHWHTDPHDHHGTPPTPAAGGSDAKPGA